MNITSFIASFQTFLNEECSQHDKKVIKRKRVFDTKLIVSKVIELVGLPNMSLKLLGFDCESSQSFAPSSFSQARKKVGFEFFNSLSQWIYSYFDTQMKDSRWLGRRVFAIDSTKIVLPKELESDGFYDFGSTSYYPLGMLTSLYDLRLGMSYDSILSQHSDEREAALHLLPSLEKGDLLIGDRGYFSFELLHKIFAQGIDFLLRVEKSNAPSEILEHIQEGAEDEFVTLSTSLPTQRKLRRLGIDPVALSVRIVSYNINSQEYLIITSLLEEEIDIQLVAKLYQCRWDIEEHFKYLKQQLEIEKFSARSLMGVLQELYAAQLIANLSKSLVLAKKGPNLKKDCRNAYSWALITGMIIRKIALIINKSTESIETWVNKLLCRARYKYRQGRKFPRESKKPQGKWIPSSSSHSS